MHHRNSTPCVHNQLRRSAVLACVMAFFTNLRLALAIAVLATVACDPSTEHQPAQQQRVGAVPELDLVQGEPTDAAHPGDCRDAYYCYGDCQGAAWLEGASAAEQHDVCADACAPSDASSRDHFGYWLDALEVECEADASDECWWSAISLDQGGHDLAVTVLDGCMREGAAW